MQQSSTQDMHGIERRICDGGKNDAGAGRESCAREDAYREPIGNYSVTALSGCDNRQAF